MCGRVISKLKCMKKNVKGFEAKLQHSFELIWPNNVYNSQFIDGINSHHALCVRFANPCPNQNLDTPLSSFSIHPLLN